MQIQISQIIFIIRIEAEDSIRKSVGLVDVGLIVLVSLMQLNQWRLTRALPSSHINRYSTSIPRSIKDVYNRPHLRSALG